MGETVEFVKTNALSRTVLHPAVLRTAIRRTAVLTATAGLLTAGLLTGPASADGPAGERADTMAACAYYNGNALTVYGQRGDRVSQAQCLLANRRYLPGEM